MTRTLIRSLAVLAVAVSLSGCISLFPKAQPVTTYRFGVVDGPSAPLTAGAASVAKGPTGFPPGAAGDRILTTNGTESAYLADARWMAPAQVLFDNALESAFDHHAGGPRLVTRGDMMTAPVNLRVDVERFEARYLDGKDAPPTVIVSLRAALVRTSNRAVIGETVIESRQRAYDNRIGPIVAAYDKATTDALGKVVDWTAGLAK